MRDGCITSPLFSTYVCPEQMWSPTGNYVCPEQAGWTPHVLAASLPQALLLHDNTTENATQIPSSSMVRFSSGHRLSVCAAPTAMRLGPKDLITILLIHFSPHTPRLVLLEKKLALSLLLALSLQSGIYKQTPLY